MISQEYPSGVHYFQYKASFTYHKNCKVSEMVTRADDLACSLIDSFHSAPSLTPVASSSSYVGSEGGGRMHCK